MSRAEFGQRFSEFSGDYSRRWCALDEYISYERTGGDKYTWTLACVACGLAGFSLVCACTLSMLVMNAGFVPDTHADDEYACMLGTCIGSPVLCAVGSIILLLMLLIGVAIARKSINDVMYPAKAIQFVTYTALAGAGVSGIHALALLCRGYCCRKADGGYNPCYTLCDCDFPHN